MFARWWRTAAVVAAAVVALLGAGVLLVPHHRPAAPAPTAQTTSATGDLEAYVRRTTAHLSKVPGDWHGWAQLGMAHVQLARATYDPAHYPLAETALDRSIAERPTDNAAALTGLGALAAARHEFTTALTYARRAVAADPWSADAYGVLTDAYVELGRYGEANDAVQHMLDLRPDTGSFGRASYLFELRGDTRAATELMTRALNLATSPGDTTFALQHLGDLAFNAGDLTTAAARYDQGLAHQSGQPALLAGRGRVAAARGDLTAAVTDLRAATATLPTVEHLGWLADTQRRSGDEAGAGRADDLIRVSARLTSPSAPSATAATDIDLVLFYADRGDATTAVHQGRSLLAGRPSVAVHTAYAWALHTAGRDREALRHADLGLRLKTRDARAHYYRGMIRLALGDRASARSDLTEALRINPYFSLRYAPMARAELDRLNGTR